MNTVTEVEIKKRGEGKKGPWTMYGVTLDDGRKASGFDLVKVGDTVALEQKGEFLNYFPVKNIPASRQQQQPNRNPPPIVEKPYVNKDDYWERKLQHDISIQPKITRQHSQAMALQVLTLKATLNELTVEDLTPAKLRALADYFDQDVMGAAI